MALLDLGRGGKARPQRMSREFPFPLGFRQIAVHTIRQDRPFDETGDMPVVEPVEADLLAPARHGAKQGAMADPGEF